MWKVKGNIILLIIIIMNAINFVIFCVDILILPVLNPVPEEDVHVCLGINQLMINVISQVLSVLN